MQQTPPTGTPVSWASAGLDEALGGQTGQGKTPAAALTLAEIKARVAPQISDARDALVARMPDGPARETAATADPYSDDFAQALTVRDDGSALGADDTDLAMAVTAMLAAVDAAERGDVDACRTWCARVPEAFGARTRGEPVDPDGPNAVTLVWVDDEGGIDSGTVDRLARCLDNAHLLTGPSYLGKVYAVRDGSLVEVQAVTAAGDSDDSDDDVATATVTVTLPDGRLAVGSWQVDGRA